ncbi:ATP-binding protein [Ahrensia marina]|uniref:ATP-binding protein n=1 Tax=Ahrensia marina TaxID=1514904 RepID=UPI0035D05DBA
MDELNENGVVLRRIADALERLAPPAPIDLSLGSADAFVWQSDDKSLMPLAHVAALPLDLLKGINRSRDTLLDNTQRFASGVAANNALLWGARGQGKSSLVKAVHAYINESRSGEERLKLIEVHREDIASLPVLLARLRTEPYRVIVFCDDLSFDAGETTYKSLKAALEGGLEGRPDNVLFYATSNRRHLLPRDMIDNESSSAINPGDAIEEKVSLSDRFGLWLGFHKCSQDEYLAMVDAYHRHFGLPGEATDLHRDALEWATTRGARSGRVAWQFIQDAAGRAGLSLS